MKKALVFLFVLLFKSLTVSAIDTLAIGKTLLEEYTLSKEHMEILEDKSGALSINDILKDSIQKKFRINTASGNSNKNLKSAYWIKFVLKNNSPDQVHYILESYVLNTYSLQLFFKDEKGIIHKQETGEAITYSKRVHQHKNLVLNLPLTEKGTSRIFYIRVYSSETSAFDFHVKSLSWFLFYTINEYYLLGFFYGILCIMAIYNLIIFFTIKAKVHLYYVFYIVSGILASLNEDKLGFQYLWREASYLNPILSYHIAPLLLISTFILYGIEFLELKKRHYKIYLIILALTSLYLVFFIYNIFIPIGLPLRFLFVLPFLAIYIASWYLLLKGYKVAKLFVVGATLILGSIILIQLRAEGIMEGNLFTVYLLNYSLILESVILSIALSDRIKIIQQEKEIAQENMIGELKENKRLQIVVNKQLQEKQVLQEEVNRELEQKVEERTWELKKANEEIKKMNELLFADNEKLEINLKELGKARVMLKGVDFEEFNKIYPDEGSCCKFLSELKWKEGFKCKKCSHQNFCEGQTPFSKRCTKCRYDESPTAYTIFQGVKFPITKAFYILFLFYSSKEKLTSTEISRILFLRQKTCWSFIHKIMEAGKNKTSVKNKKLEGWASLILD